MIRRFIDWLGPQRALALFLVIGVTGALSLMLQAVGPATSWVVPVQNVLLLIALGGLVGIPVSRFGPIERRTLLIAIGPLVAAVPLGMLLPDFFLWFLGAGMGWAIVSWVMFRRNIRREYQQAIRHLRRSEYDEAIQIMNDLIKAEPTQSAHHRFRADLYRLKGDPKRALKDYQRIVDLEPDSGVGYNGLAEVYLQQGEYDHALEYARRAYAAEPGQWVMPYNLGMIEDRLGMATEAVAHLQEALTASHPDVRHQVLIHLWLARAYARLDQRPEAEAECEALRGLKSGLREWETIFGSEQSATLREVLAEDVTLARRIADGAGPEVFADASVPTEAGS